MTDHTKDEWEVEDLIRRLESLWTNPLDRELTIPATLVSETVEKIRELVRELENLSWNLSMKDMTEPYG